MIVSPGMRFTVQKDGTLENSEGNSRGNITYPPGIPVVCMGERITADIISYIKLLKEQKCELQGTVDPYVNNIRVLGR